MTVSKNFISRIAEGTLASLILVTSIVTAYNHPYGRWFFALLLLAITCLAAWEFCLLIQKKGIAIFTSLLLICGGGYLFLYELELFSYLPKNMSLIWLLLGLGVFSSHILRKKQDITLAAACTVLGFIYIFIPTKLLLDMTYASSSPTRWWLIWTLLIVKGSDMAAYFGGKLIGKIPLTSISPKKTVEGFVIGCFSGAILSFAMGFAKDAPQLSWFVLCSLGITIATVASVGDLIESRLKREVGVKDSNPLLQGLGGFLDMIDSLTLAVPFAYFFYLMFRATT